MNNNTKCDLALRIRPLKAALQISFRDIQFISAYHHKILLPSTGDLPQVIQQYIINDALETIWKHHFRLPYIYRSENIAQQADHRFPDQLYNEKRL